MRNSPLQGKGKSIATETGPSLRHAATTPPFLIPSVREFRRKRKIAEELENREINLEFPCLSFISQHILNLRDQPGSLRTQDLGPVNPLQEVESGA